MITVPHYLRLCSWIICACMTMFIAAELIFNDCKCIHKQYVRVFIPKLERFSVTVHNRKTRSWKRFWMYIIIFPVPITAARRSARYITTSPLYESAVRVHQQRPSKLYITSQRYKRNFSLFHHRLQYFIGRPAAHKFIFDNRRYLTTTFWVKTSEEIPMIFKRSMIYRRIIYTSNTENIDCLNMQITHVRKMHVGFLWK